MKKTLYLALFLFLQQFLFSQCLNGIYTIGGASPSFTSITQAVTTLTVNGVCGPVTFNIRPGTYNERIAIPVVAGSSSVNTIVFQSETADSSSTILQVVGNSSQNYVVKLDGTDYVSIKNLTLKNTDGNYMCLVYLVNGVANFSLSNCVIDAPVTASILPNANRYLINSATSTNVNCIIQNSKITGGQRGIYASSNSSLITDFRILNSVFFNQYEYSISLSGVRAPKIISNKISYNLANTGFKGMYISSSNDVVVIDRNSFDQTFGESITLFFAGGNSSNYSSVSNNRINISGGATATSGIYLQNASYMNVYHNSVVSVNTNTNSSCVALYTMASVNIKNNILYHKGAGPVYYIFNTLTGAQFDYNDVYCLGSRLAFNISTDVPNFAAWKGLGYDPNSLNYVPQFVSASDFHIASDFSQNLSIPFMPSVPVDIEGTVRDNISPYFGAYEYANFLNATDASVNKIQTNTVNCFGNNPVKVLLKNLGTNNLTSANINWVINGVTQTPYAWSGNLGFYDTTTVAIGNYNSLNLSTYSITAWSSAPNGTTDNVLYNDTAKSGLINAAMSGTYTVGGSSPSFVDLTSAMNNLRARGVCGNVTLNLRNGYYYGNYTLTAIPGLSNANSLTIQSESGNSSLVSLTESDVTKSLFTSADVENFSLKNVSVFNSTNNITLFNFNGRAINVELSGCNISAIRPSSAVYFNSASNPIQNIRIIGNTFTSGSNFVAFVNSSASNNTYNVKVLNNTMNTNDGGGTIELSDFDSLEIRNNVSVNTTTSNPVFNVSNANYVRLQNNKALAQNVSGISLSNIQNGIIANNMVVASGSLTVNAVAMSAYNNVRFINNSILCKNTNAGSYGLSLSNYITGSANKIWNNAIYNSNGGRLIKLLTYTNILPGLKNNAYYSSGSVFGSYNSADITGLVPWKTTVVSDTNSLFVNPQYTSLTDLHANEILLNNAGVSVSSDIVDDIDGQTRNAATPDIGADEFTPLTLDAATNGFDFSTVLCAGTNSIGVVLKNNGSTILTSAKIGCKINATNLPQYSWNGSLAPGTQTVVSIGTYSFVLNTTYNIKAWSSLPNGSADVFRNNDTTYQNYSNVGMSGVFTIGGASPTYSTIASAVAALKNGGVCGPVVFNIRDGVYNEQVKIQNIKGVSSTNTILFQSQSLDSSLVSIEYSSNGTLNYNIAVDSTDYITFYKLGFKALNASYGNILTFTNKTNNITIKNCSFTGQTSSGNLVWLPLYCDSASILNNRFYKGLFGVLTSSAYNKINGNYFEDQYQYGIYGQGLNLDYSLNRFNCPTVIGNQAIYINGASSGKISKNQISYNSTTTNAVMVTANAGSAVNTLYITNNFISLNGGVGVRLAGSQYVYLINNSINQRGNGSCLSYSNTSNSSNINNILYDATNYCVNVSGTNTGFVSNYNCIYSPSAKLINVNGTTTYSTLSAYTASTSLEANSVSADPLFTSAADLHITNSAAVSGSAVYNASVTDDIDGDARSSSTPDIGADEFTLLNVGNDVQVSQLFVTNSGCGGSQTLYAKIKNIGTNVLTTAQFSGIAGNNSFGPVTWNGSLPQGQTKDSVLLGVITSLYGNMQIKAWSFSPNGLPDGNLMNDTLVYQLPNTALKGVYKVGGTTPDFATLRQVKNALVSYGVCAPVTFDIRPGTYQDTLSIPSVAGSSSTNTILFQSENGDSTSVIISDFAVASTSNPHYVLRLRGLSNVTFSKLTFMQNVTSSVNPPYLIYGDYISANSYSNINILNSCARSASVTNTAFYIGTMQNMQGLAIKNCLVTGGNNGITVSNISSTASTVLIKDNVLLNQNLNGITLNSARGINTVEHNTVKRSGLTVAYAIYGYNSASLIVRKNEVSSAVGTGIYAYSGIQSINNNFVYLKSSNSFNGIYCENALAGSAIVYNTVRIKSGNSNNFYANSCSGIVKNNIFENKGTGKVYNIGTPATLTISINRCVTTGSVFGSRILTNYNSFGSWVTSTGYDVGSQNQNTYFINDSTYKVIGDYPLNGAAVAIAGITDDIDGNVRNAGTPDIGAYEFNLSNDDAGVTRFGGVMDSVLCPGANSITVVLRNFGASNLNSATINWKLDNILQPAYNWTGSVLSGDSVLVTVGSVNLLSGRTHQFLFYTSNPNGTNDVSNYNDTLKTRAIKTRLSGVYTIGGALPDYLTLQQATDSLQRFGLCGPVTYNIRNGVHKGGFSLNNVQGVSSVNTILFQSESQDSSLVVISDSSASIGMYVNYVTFNKLSFNQKGSTGYPTMFVRGSDITFSGCVFSAVYNGGQLDLDFQRNWGPLKVKIKNTLFKRSAGLVSTSSASSGAYASTVILSDCYFKASNFSVDDVDSIVVSNTVFDRNYLARIKNSAKTISVYNNKFLKCTGLILEAGVASAFPKTFYNNIVDSCYLYLYNTPQVDVYHNVFSFDHPYAPSSAGGGLIISGDPSLYRIRNNIFSNKGGGACLSIAGNFYFTGSGTPNIFNNNVLYTTGDTVLQVSRPLTGYASVSLSTWQNMYFQDQNSVFAKPSFAGINDFHIVNDHQIDNLGAPNSISVTDMDGITRNLSTPDVGPYEFTGVPTLDDAGILSIQNTGNYCAGSSNPIVANLKNYGANVLTDATIQWSVNGVAQPDYTWTGNLAPGTSSLVTIGTYSMQLANTYITLINTTLPNGNADGYIHNDTLRTVINSSKLNGTYIVGAAGSQFVTIDDVFNALFNYGICGPVNFKFLPGTYQYSLSDITLGNIPGNSVQNTITFESANGNNSTAILDDIYFKLTNVYGITFKNLTLKRNLVNIASNSKKIAFEGNLFKDYPTYNNGQYCMIYSNQYHEDVRIVNNYFMNCQSDFIQYSHALGSQYPKRVFISGNTFDNPPLTVMDINNVDSLVIDSNYFYRTNTNSSNSQGIRILHPRDYFKISRNRMTGTFETGIYISTKYGNHIGNSSIENNAIISTYASAQGCISSSCDSISILYNSLHMSTTYPIYAALNVGSKNKVYNNILSSQGGKLMTVGTPATTLSDYNVFYTTGANLITYPSTTVTSLSTYSVATGREVHSIVANPQFVSLTNDLHYTNHALDGRATPIPSVLIDQQNKPRNALSPNPGAYEAAPDTTVDAVNKFLVLKSIQTPTFVVGVNNTITASILYTYPQLTDTNTYKYRGTIDSLRIHYQVNNQPEVIEKWHGTLHLNDSLTYSFAAPFFVPNGKLYNLKVWFENLNPANHEINLSDDSLVKAFTIPMQGNYTIGGIYPDFADYESTLLSMQAVGTSGNVRFLYRPGDYFTSWGYTNNFPSPHTGSVEFTSESGNPDDVKINLSWIDDVNSLLKFSKVTIIPNYNNGTVYGPFDGIKISCVAETVFDSCQFYGGATAYSRVGLHFLYQTGGVASTITNCKFKNLNFAVYLSGHDSYCGNGSTNSSFTFMNNTIDSCSHGVLASTFAPGTSGIKIINNSIKTYSTGISLSKAVTGTSGSVGGTSEISGNKIESQTGINIGSPYLSDVSPLLYKVVMTNNMVSSTSSNIVRLALKLNMYNNSFNRKTYVSCRDTSEIYNNIFTDNATSGCLELSYSTNLLKSDNNNMYAPNSPTLTTYIKTQAAAPYALISQYNIPGVAQIPVLTQLDSNSIGFTPLYVSATDLHSQSSNMKNTARALATVTLDIDGESRLIDAPDIGADEIQLLFADVWPGDADNDLSVTAQDLYSIGLHYGNHGYARDSISNLYIGHTCNNWNVTQLGNSNDQKFADCNGDSTINMNDTLAIHLNYNLVHLPKSLSVTTSSLSDIYVQCNKSLYLPGDTVKADVLIGSASVLQGNLYGAAFKLNYDMTMVKPNSEKMSFINSWIGNINSTKIKFSKINHSIGLLDASLVRLTHTDVSGWGKIGTFEFVLNDTLTGNTLHFDISNATKVDHNGNITPLYSGADSVAVVSNGVVTSLSEKMFNSVNVYPNPASEYVKIDFTGYSTVKYKLELSSMDGKTVLIRNVVTDSYTLPLNNMAKGIYALKLIMEDGNTRIYKLVIQ